MSKLNTGTQTKMARDTVAVKRASAVAEARLNSDRDNPRVTRQNRSQGHCCPLQTQAPCRPASIEEVKFGLKLKTDVKLLLGTCSQAPTASMR
jgi:hypothetical protein